MKRYYATLSVFLLLIALVINYLPIVTTVSSQQKSAEVTRMSARAEKQIQALLTEKDSRTKSERKIDSALLYAIKQKRGEAVASGVGALETNLKVNEKNLTEINIKGFLSDELLQSIENSGGEIIYASKRYNSIKAAVPLEVVSSLADLEGVTAISPAGTDAITHGEKQLNNRPRGARLDLNRPNFFNAAPPTAPPQSFVTRSSNVREQLRERLSVPTSASSISKSGKDALTSVGAATSLGDDAHRARAARNFYGINGRAVRIGVLSDSDDFKEQSQATGDLPPECTNPTGPKTTPCTYTLPGQDGREGSGEGTAMMEIIHDVAPGAQIYFATAFISGASFADNIRRLRDDYDCDIIVDDVIYFVESPFQDDLIAAAVNDVTADGALYFSSAGNEGNFNDGSSGTWEGDFRSGGRLANLPGYQVHDFGSGVASNVIEFASFPIVLHWSDPIGASDNDYDLFELDANLTTVVAASTNVQDGDDRPYEQINTAAAGRRIVIARKNGAERRALNVLVFGGELGIATPGATRGHNSARAGFGVAAVNAATAGGGAFTGGPTNPVEVFSSDGFRRVFYNEDGTPITPGNVLFRTNGGEVRRKPDIAAADGVATTVPGLTTFFGTSAAAPHAAAIAALLKSAEPTLTTAVTPEVVRLAFTSTALDIEANGVDRDSGFGIVDAFAALRFIGAQPRPTLERGTVTTTPISGDGDAFVEPGEAGSIRVQLNNIGGANARTIRTTLTTSTPGVTIAAGNSVYPNLAPGASAVNNSPFIFSLSNSVLCGTLIRFQLAVTYQGRATPQIINFTVQTGQPSNSAVTVSYTGPPVPIASNAPVTVTVPLTVSGFVGSISDLNFRIDGSNCTAAVGASTVGIDHSFVSDLVIRLTSPAGTTVTLINATDGGGNNFCQTVLDDSATRSIQSVLTAEAPFTGTFLPASPLAAFNGENPNGTWTLTVNDIFSFDGGNVRAFSLVVTPFECN